MFNRLPGTLFCALVLGLVLSATTPVAVLAQVPPTSTEVAAYEGLHRAAATGDMALLKSGLEKGEDVNARDPYQRTPLHVAAYFRQRDAMKALAAAGADPNALEVQAYDAVTIAAVADDLETLQTALAIGDKAGNITSPYHGTALIAAAHLGHDEVVRVLIAANAPLDHVNNLGWTALIEAVILGDGGPRHQKTVEYLVRAGADRTIADRDGVTPLEHAQRRGYKEIEALLLR
jgi:uncharacterized protein